MSLWAGRRIGTLVLDFGSTRSLSLARFDHLIELHLGASWDELEPGQGVAGTCKPSIVLPLLELTSTGSHSINIYKLESPLIGRVSPRLLGIPFLTDDHGQRSW